jgi:tetratricopeptide (TPR) repeat protein
VNRLAARIRGDISVEPIEFVQIASEHEAPIGTSSLGQSGESAGTDIKEDQANGLEEKTREIQGFSLVGAEPDDVNPFDEDHGLPVMGEAHEQDAHQKEGIQVTPASTAQVSTVAKAVPPSRTASRQEQSEPVRAPSTGEPTSATKDRRQQSKAIPAPVPHPTKAAVDLPSSHLTAPEMPSVSPTVATKEPAGPLPDYEAHYALGVAYKNMGLYEEAKEEFQVSMNSDSFYLDSALMTAVCLKEERQIALAIRGLETVLADPRCEGAKGQAIRYELGLLYEAEEQWEKASHAFQSIPSFHDVPQRLAALKGKQRGGDSGFRYVS